MNSGGKKWTRNAAAVLKRVDSTQPRLLKMPLIRGERAGVPGKSLLQMFERLEERIGLPAHGRRMLAEQATSPRIEAEPASPDEAINRLQ